MKVRRKPAYQEKEFKPGLVSPAVAAILSAIIPGLGQAFSRMVRRGVILFFSFASIIGLMIWRFRNAAPRDTGAIAIIKKAFHLDPVMLLITILIGILYLYNIYDAYKVAANSRKGETRKPFMVFVALLLVFFFIGWQIGEIDIYALVTQFDDALPALSKVLWPWSRAITYLEDEQMGTTIMISPCPDGSVPEPNTPPEEGPYLIADPTCGDFSTQEDLESGETIIHLGTELNVHGYGFLPGVEVEIWWRDPTGSDFRQRQDSEIVIVIPDENGEFEVTINWPYRTIPESYMAGGSEWELQGRQTTVLDEWVFSEELILAVEKMIETIFIGMMATFFGIILALPFSFLAARNLMSANAFTMGIYYLVRGILNIIRSIEPLIWAILAVIIVGLGPWAGILALTVHSIAALGKLYSEAIESIDNGPIEAVQATGANWFQIVMYAVVPQVIPPFVSFTIYRWDVNIRMSTIIGMVGGGGIGYLLVQWIRNLDYRAAGIAVWFIAVTVAILDYVSAEIRERFT